MNGYENNFEFNEYYNNDVLELHQQNGFLKI